MAPKKTAQKKTAQKKTAPENTAPTDWLGYCLAKPGAWQDEPWENDVVTKVGNKIFAFLANPHVKEGRRSLGLKCGDREAADIWLERYPGSAAKMPYIGAHGWNTFALDGSVPDEDLQELIDQSYDLVVAKLAKRLRPGT